MEFSRNCKRSKAKLSLCATEFSFREFFRVQSKSFDKTSQWKLMDWDKLLQWVPSDKKFAYWKKNGNSLNSFWIELNFKNKLIENKNFLLITFSFRKKLRKSNQISQSMNFDVFRINLWISIFHYLRVICIEFVTGVLLRDACKSGCLVFQLQCICLTWKSIFSCSFNSNRMWMQSASLHPTQRMSTSKKICTDRVEEKKSNIACIESK